MLSTVESMPERPTAAEASAALTDAEASRATLARGIVTPPWFFTSMGAAIATQIATTAYALSGRRWMRGYRAHPAVHGRGESAAWLALVAVTATAGLALLLISA